MLNTPLHQFHIPVMGLAFSIDSPIKVARFGISSVVSIMEDRLIETMRNYYYTLFKQPYIPIATSEPDYRAKRITDYLNLLNRIVKEQVEKIRNEHFKPGSEIVKYFELLPGDCSIKQLFQIMQKTDSPVEKVELEHYLRTQIRPGSIDVNIMTKLDRNYFDKKGEIVVDGSDAVAALRGYANSDLVNSSIIFSAGLNPRLYNYLEQCKQFKPDKSGLVQKKVIIKVSDYRSALIQGKYLAKKGIWVSEFRVESGLNCGGHAFATDGFLMGPILEEFKTKRQELTDTIFAIYKAALECQGEAIPHHAPALKISAQGGIGTSAEDRFLHNYYGMDSTGWGTPFLLVPEATTVDEPTLKLLCAAKKEDVVLSDHSPLGVKFHYLKGTTSESERLQRVLDGKPGSPCTEKHLVSNTEFTTEPICTASKKYQQLKIAELQSLPLTEQDRKQQISKVLGKECLCIGLSNPAANRYNVPFLKKLEAVTICPGPNIAWFNKTVSLETMVSHIYGRSNLLQDSPRPHMFINELNLYIDFLRDKATNATTPRDSKQEKYLGDFYKNLLSGIEYYRRLPISESLNEHPFHNALNKAETALRGLGLQQGLGALKVLTMIS